MAWGAIALLARSELRTRWRSLLALGVLAGLAAAAVLGAGVVARRTSTAPERLRVATAAGDARAMVYGDRRIATELAGHPAVARSWTASFGVGQVAGDVVRFVGVLAGPDRPAGLFTPVVVEGRAPDPSDPNEVLLSEALAGDMGAGLGDVLRVALLTPDEVAQFDTGFGAPDGPALTLRVTGIMRTPAGTESIPVLGTPALHARHGEAMAAGHSAFLELHDRPGAFAAIRAEADRLDEVTPRPAGAEEFPTVDLTDPRAADAGPEATGRVLVSGLLAAALVAALAGLLALAQAAARHHAGRADAARVEAALGLTAIERVTARVLPAALSAAVAGALAGAGGLAAATVEPAGALRRVEPHPGWVPNVAVTAAGVAVTAVAVLLVVAATAARAGRREPAHRRPAPATRLAGFAGRAPVVVGLRFAFDPGRGRSRVPVRSSVAGAVLGVAGVVAALTFGASIDRLTDEPARWGWSADLNLVDATDAIAEELVADERVAAVSVLDQAPVRLGGATVSGQVLDPHKGTVGWTVLDGRDLGGPGEVVLGTRVARRLGLEPGDRIDGLDVVGVGIGPSVNNEPLGEMVLLPLADFDERKRTEPFANALVRAAPGVDGAALAASLGERYEVFPRVAPTEVRDLGELGGLPGALGAFLAALAAAALAHALVVTTRRRSGDLAVLRALGFTPRQTGASLVTMAVATAGAGIAAGVPLGLLAGRLVWWAVATPIGAGADPSLPLVASAVLAAAFVAGAVVVAAVPARRAARLRPAVLLRTE